jgi:hypothetical protein
MIKRMKCANRPAFFGCEDNQLTPGRFYNVLDVDMVDDRIFYTVIGNDNIQIQRPADYFKFPAKVDPKKIQLMCAKCAHKVKPKRGG